MYEIFELLCAKRGITPYKFCKDAGVSTSTISTWKTKNSQCRPELAEKVCEYFGISHDYLMTGKESTMLELAQIDVDLSNMSNRMKEYALKMAELPKDKQEHIMSLIDMLT